MGKPIREFELERAALLQKVATKTQDDIEFVSPKHEELVTDLNSMVTRLREFRRSLRVGPNKVLAAEAYEGTRKALDSLCCLKKKQKKPFEDCQ